MGGWRMGNTIDGCQAEYVRIHHAMANLTPVPDGLTDEQVLMCPDIMSTGFGGAESGGIRIGDTVAVFAQGPIGLCATAGAKLMGATTIIGVETLPDGSRVPGRRVTRHQATEHRARLRATGRRARHRARHRSWHQFACSRSTLQPRLHRRTAAREGNDLSRGRRASLLHRRPGRGGTGRARVLPAPPPPLRVAADDRHVCRVGGFAASRRGACPGRESIALRVPRGAERAPGCPGCSARRWPVPHRRADRRACAVAPPCWSDRTRRRAT